MKKSYEESRHFAEWIHVPHLTELPVLITRIEKKNLALTLTNHIQKNYYSIFHAQVPPSSTLKTAPNTKQNGE